MPVSPGDATDLAKRTLEIYAESEEILLGRIARRLARGETDGGGYDRKLLEIQGLRREAESIVARLLRGLLTAVEEAVRIGYNRGIAAAGAELLDRVAPGVAFGIVNERAVQALVDVATARVRDLAVQILREVVDAFRDVTTRAAAQVVTGAVTRQEATAQVVADMASAGIQFTDRSGRRWEAGAYAEMATRTITAQAMVQGHLDRLREIGHPLVYVSDSWEECPLCRPWEGRVLTVAGPPGARVVREEHGIQDDVFVRVPVAGSVAEAILAGLMHPNCFPGEVLVSAPSGVVAADARWYEGPLVVVHTASGDELPVTPNHPVLTTEGWVAAGALKVGQRVLRYGVDVERSALGGPDDEQVPARIGDVFDALRQTAPVPPVRVPVAAEQFHGDGFGSDVDVVLADGLLGDGTGQVCGDGEFVGGGVGSGSLLARSSAFEVVDGAGHAPHRVVGGGDLPSALLCRHGRPLPAPGFAGVGAVSPAEQGGTHRGLGPADLFGDLTLRDAGEVHLDSSPDPGSVAVLGDSGGAELAVEGGSVDLHGGRDLVRRLAGQVAPDRVVQVEQRRQWAGHVYNLQTGDGWYVAGGIVVHNCTHSFSAYIAGVTRLRPAVANPEGYERRQRQRALERRVRRWKREVSVLGAARDAAKGRRRTLPATDPLEKKYRRALAFRKKATDDLAAFIEEHDRKRLRYRERPVKGKRPATVARPAEPVDPLHGVDLQRMTDEQLADLFATFADDPATLERVEAEFNRRDAAEAAAAEPAPPAGQPEPGPFDFPDPDPAADEVFGADVHDTDEDRRVDELVARGWSYRDAYADVYGLDAEQLARDERNAAIDVQRMAGESREDTVRRLYSELVHTQWVAAEQATNGYLLSREGEAAGIDALTLFSGPVVRARKYASEELKRWWQDNPRVTYTEFRADMLGRRADREAADRIRRQGNDRDFGL